MDETTTPVEATLAWLVGENFIPYIDTFLERFNLTQNFVQPNPEDNEWISLAPKSSWTN